jgi:hypothetical protein
MKKTPCCNIEACDLDCDCADETGEVDTDCDRCQGNGYIEGEYECPTCEEVYEECDLVDS